MAKKRWATMPFSPVFRVSANGPIIMPNGDFLEAILNSSFDWNGIREPYLVATENDALNGVTMLVRSSC